MAEFAVPLEHLSLGSAWVGTSTSLSRPFLEWLTENIPHARIEREEKLGRKSCGMFQFYEGIVLCDLSDADRMLIKMEWNV